MKLERFAANLTNSELLTDYSLFLIQLVMPPKSTSGVQVGGAWTVKDRDLTSLRVHKASASADY
jgi:hypothetical protein